MINIMMDIYCSTNASRRTKLGNPAAYLESDQHSVFFVQFGHFSSQILTLYFDFEMINFSLLIYYYLLPLHIVHCEPLTLKKKKKAKYN